MEQGKNKTMVPAVIIAAALGLALPVSAAQTTKGSDTSMPDKATEHKGTSAATSSSDSSMKSSDAMKSDQTTRASRTSRSTSGRWSKEDVKKVQEALKDKGNDPGPADGVLGPQTQKAIRAFQQSQGLKSTGRLDAETAKALGVEHSGSSGESSSMGTGSSMGAGSSSGSKSSSGANSSGTSSSTNGKSGAPASK